MPRLLLDTHVLLWALEDSQALSVDARQSIADTRNEVFVSAVSIWEMAIKRSLGKLRAPDNLADTVQEAGFAALPITLAHAEQAGMLPPHHRDPFDRMLCLPKALAEGLVVVTDDALTVPPISSRTYGVRTMPA